MLTRTYSASIFGVDAFLVTVEASVGLGLPCLTLVGRATGALVEARERVKSALGHCGHAIAPRKQIVNLAPADERKESPGIDLAVAAGLLAAHGVIPPERLEREVLLWGELALDGVVRPAVGTLVIAECARREGFRAIAVAEASAAEASRASGPSERLVSMTGTLRPMTRPAPVAPLTRMNCLASRLPETSSGATRISA